MRLLRLKLENFKGVRDFTLEPQGRDISVHGPNASGKTTLADSSWWLLFGKNSSGATDFNVLPLGPDGKRVPGVTEAEVEAVLAYDGGGIHDGRQVTLKKVYREVWTKKRGRSAPEYSGNTVDYWIDGVPKKAGEYAAFIRSLADEEQFKLVSNPRYFNEILDWKARRKVVMGLDSNVTDADVMASDPELAALAEALKGRTVEDYRKVVDADIKRVNQELDKLPIRVDEAQRGLPDPMQLPGDLQDLRNQRADKAALMASMDAGGLIASKVQALREIEGQIVDLDNKARQASGKATAAAQAEVDKAQGEIKSLERNLADLRESAQRVESDIKVAELAINSLAAEWEKATERTFAHEDVATCYACAQPLPQADVQAAHDRALATFNAAKSREIEQIERAGAAKQETLKALRAKLDKTQDDIAKVNAEIETARNTLILAENRLTAIKTDIAAVSEDPRRHQLVDQQLGIQAEIEDLKKTGVDPAKDKLAGEIAGLDSLIAETEKASANNQRRQATLQRIDELKAQQKDLGKTYESLERQRDLCERFVVAKANLTNEKVNSHFPTVRFKLYEVQINGGINDQMCEVTVNGVPYSDLNNAARINAGLELIDVLSGVYGISAPIFVDNAEAVCELLPTRGQQIRLYVSAADKVLRVEAK